MASFADLQTEHQALLDRLPKGRPGEQYLGEVQAFIARATAEAANVPASRDRDQLRANLRFWASYVFDHTGAYPDTTLRPSLLADTGAGAAPAPRRPRWLFPAVAAAGGGLCLALVLCAVLVLPGSPVTGFLRTPTPSDSVAATEFTLTPDRTATHLAGIALTAGTPLAPTRTATASPVPSITVTPQPPPATEPPARRTLMLADFAHEPGPDCAFDTVQVSADGAGLIAPNQLRGAVAELRFPGSQEPDAAAEIGPNGASLSLELFDGDQTNQALLLSVSHPALTFSSVILQFQPGCGDNQAVVRYAAAEAPSALAEQPERVPNLDLGWTLITWGPAPEDDEAWIAQIELFARGGDGNYIFWDGAAHLTDEPNILLSQRACVTAQRAVGVSSGGVSLLREIILQTPYCPGP